MAGYLFVTVPTSTLTFTLSGAGTTQPPQQDVGTFAETAEIDDFFTLEFEGDTGFVGDVVLTFQMESFSIDGEGIVEFIGIVEIDITLYDFFDFNAELLNGMAMAGELDLPPPDIELSASGLTGTIGQAELDFNEMTLVVTIDEPMTFTDITLEASGYAGWAGAFDESLPITLSATGYGSQYGSLELTITGITLSATGYDSTGVNIDLTMPMWSISAAGITGNAGYLDETTSLISLSATGYPISTGGDVDTDFPTITLEAEGWIAGSLQPATATETFVVNTNNFAVTEYNNFNFNSFCYFNGIYLGANSNGIYRIDGTNDAGTNISVRIQKEKIDLGTSLIKKATDAYFSIEDTGEIMFEMTADNISFPYYMRNGHPGLRNIKLPIGKGIKGQYLGFKIENVRGSDIKISHIKMIVESTQRRIRSASYG